MRDGSKYMRHTLFRHNVVVTHCKPDILREKPYVVFFILFTKYKYVQHNFI